MIRYITLFALAVFISFASTAQNHGLKGPAAKNYKPWKNPKAPKPILVSRIDKVKGPEAKNARPFEKAEKTLIVKTEVPKERIMGPRAKNKKPWDDTETSSVAALEQ